MECVFCSINKDRIIEGSKNYEFMGEFMKNWKGWTKF